MKKCFKCGIKKPIGEFYAHPQMADGHLNKCKECTKRDVKADYKAKREKKSNYERERNKRPDRRAKKLIYERNHRLRNPQKAKARTMVGHALRSGKLKRLPCKHCGSKKVQAHHHDYSKPLDVTWECFKCHREREHGQTVTSSF